MFFRISRITLMALILVALSASTPTSAGEDTAPPRVRAFNLSPTEVNTENESQDITVTATITDDQSGVSLFPDGNFAVELEVEPLIGTQWQNVYLDRISGTDLNGVYEGTLTLPKSAKAGVWEAKRFNVADKVGNYRSYSTSQLSAVSPNVTIVNTAEANSVKIEREWRIRTSNVSVTFPKDTVVARGDGGRFAFYEMATQEISIIDSTAAGLDGEPVSSVRLGIPGLNLSFSKDVSITFNVGSQYNGYTFLLQSLNEGGSSWANEETANVINGKVTFTVNHATRFTANLVDRTKPVVKMVTPFVSTRISKTTTFKVKWSATDAPYSSGIRGYKVRFRPSTSKTWRTWKNNVRAKEDLFKGKAGVTYYFRTKTVDNAGNYGWSKVYKTIVPFNEGIFLRKIGFNGYQKLGRSQNYLSSVRYSYGRGHTLVYKLYRNNAIGLVVTKGPKMGRAKIYVDGKYVRTVDAYSSKRRARQLIFYRGFKKKGTHYLKIVNLGTPGRAKFEVDGAVVGR